MTTPTETGTGTETTNTVDEHGEDLLTRELSQLSFKDRNDYHGKCYDDPILNNYLNIPYYCTIMYPLYTIQYSSSI
jgi:hypothetical protein